MGQKTHPLGFRLGITQDHKSTWYTHFQNYKTLIKEDDEIRTSINKIAKSAGISNIKISRNSIGNQIQLTLETARPGLLVGNNGLGITNLIKNLKQFLPVTRQLMIDIVEIEKFNLDASLICDLVVKQLEERIAFRRAMREAIQLVQENQISGIKIQISGRLNGAEIARSEWSREGRVPLQTLRANIDYSAKQANTIYGVLGIKVWLFKNEI